MTKADVLEWLARRLALSQRLCKMNKAAERIARYEGKVAAFREAMTIVEKLEERDLRISMVSPHPPRR